MAFLGQPAIDFVVFLDQLVRPDVQSESPEYMYALCERASAAKTIRLVITAMPSACDLEGSLVRMPKTPSLISCTVTAEELINSIASPDSAIS